MSSAQATVEMLLPPTPESVAIARHAADELPVPRAVKDDMRLLISEVVTNSVRHAGLSEADRIRLAVDLRDRCVRVEVCDRGPGFDPRPRPRTDEDESGWGLHFVEQLADRWGVVQNDVVRVWFELSTAQEQRAS